MADIRQIYGRKLKSWSLYKKQLLYSIVIILESVFGHCLPYIRRMSAAYQFYISAAWPAHIEKLGINFRPYIRRMSAVCRPYISRISAVYQPYIRRMSAVCQPSVSRMSAVCQPYIRRMSAVCQPWNGRMSAVCQPYISRMSAVCQPYVRRMSAIPNLPICHELLAKNFNHTMLSGYRT